MTDLIARLEAATKGGPAFDFHIAEHVGTLDMPVPEVMGALPYSTSIDAGLTLVLEGYAIDAAFCPETGSVVRVYKGPARENTAGEPTGHAKTMALALCIAALRARTPEETA